jgi:hypothetical protein
VGCASEDNEENTSEYSHDPSSLRSTLESNPDLASQMETLGAQEIEIRPGGKYRMCEVRANELPSRSRWPNSPASLVQKPIDYCHSSESDSDEGSNITIATQMANSPKMRVATTSTNNPTVWQ